MNFLVFVSLLIIGLAIGSVNGDGAIELVCNQDADCRSFANITVRARCFGKCSCFFKDSGLETACSPQNLKILNQLAGCPCRVVNTECLNDKCVCKEGFIKSEDKSKCISMVVNLGKSCDTSAQCRRFERNSACRDGICQCKDQFIQINNSTCRSLAKNKDEKEKVCDIKSPCKVSDNEECLRNRCVCKQNYIYGVDKTECVQYANLDELCVDNIQCEMGVGNGTKCDFHCKCDEHHTETQVNGKNICQRSTSYMQACILDVDCEKYEDDFRMWCVDQKCVCREGYFLNDETKECVLVEPSSATKSAYISSAVIIAIIFSLFFM